MSFNDALKRFARLRQGDSAGAIENSVDEIIDALKVSVSATSDLPGARREIANLLSYLHELRKSKHPGRVLLATALAEQVLPHLYDSAKPAAGPATVAPAAESGRYPFIDEENAVLDRAAAMMSGTLQFLAGEDPEHPRHGAPTRDDAIPPLFAFNVRFARAFRSIAATAFRAFLRRKRTELQLYKPVRDAVADAGQAGIQRFDDEIRKSLLSSFDQAQKAFERPPPSDGAPGGLENRAKPKSPAAPDAEEERVAMHDALEAARLKGKEDGYFLPRNVDYALLAQLFMLDRTLVSKGLTELGHAVAHGEEGENYVSRQVERLNASHDLMHFDLTILSAFQTGAEEERLSFKQMHDTCIGAATSREVMSRVRPLLVAELSRRPHQLARQLLRDASDPDVTDDTFQQRLETFMRWAGTLNNIRFEQEIYGCVSQLWGKPVFLPLIGWMQDDNRAQDKIDAVLMEVCTARASLG